MNYELYNNEINIKIWRKKIVDNDNSFYFQIHKDTYNIK